MSVSNPVEPWLENRGALILDSGLATRLEDRGFDLTGRLWSARVVVEQPSAILEAHRAFLAAGALCITTASYQASLEGLIEDGLSRLAAARLIEQTLELALEAREPYAFQLNGQTYPLVAASIGPYGAYLADGSEYRGQYGLAEEELVSFHRDRWRLLAAAGADVMACETQPSRLEARALLQLLSRSRCWAWLSFTLRDPGHLSDGTPLVAVIEELQRDFPEAWGRVCAVGVNCVPPALVEPAIRQIRQSCDKAIVVYPNSGEIWDAERHCWRGARHQWVRQAPRWYELGAGLIGGCCRTRVADIEALGRLLSH